MSWELATESNDEDTVKSTTDTYNETIEIDNSTESSGNSSDFDLSFHQGWRSWSASLGAYKIHLKKNMGFTGEETEIKFGSYIELYGHSNKDQGLDWKWETTNSFKLEEVKK